MNPTFYLIVFALTAFVSQLSFAYDEPIVIGHGRYLSTPEQQALFRMLEQSKPTADKQQYIEAYRNYSAHHDQTDRIAVLQFTRFSAVVNPDWYQKTKTGNEILMICFGCEEGIPIKERVRRETHPTHLYDIWIFSGEFILLDKHPQSGEWHLLYSGGAE
ncbi:hypothetical protein HUU62_01930 [Rhodoferax sp. 4810]|uniref:Uncharacterized protein n=1 Tax=Thiospirillum jenense TaxID=1653858 RepID=A0A839HAX9_9GAMM|nr:hypothetical protein [Thiospirillum jenense]MBB1073173.1 hypothetical protein [Rhodoferax jenense]MBB1124666.1 hypothetical protein [Thiospirillum jenense]